MERKYIRRLGAVLMTLSLLIMSGCTSISDVRLRLVVHAVGIDMGEEDIYNVSFQVFTAQPPEGGGPVDATGQNVTTIMAYGRSIYEAQKMLEAQTGKEVFMGDCELIVLGDSFRDRDISKVLSYFWNSGQIYMGVNVAFSEGLATEVVGVTLEHGTATTELLNQMITVASKDSRAMPTRLISVSNMIDKSRPASSQSRSGTDTSQNSGPKRVGFIMPVFSTGEADLPVESEVLNLNKTAVGVFKNILVIDGYPTDYVTNEEARGVCLLTDSASQMNLELDIDGSRASVLLRSLKTKRSIKISESGYPVITATISGSIEIIDDPDDNAFDLIDSAACRELLRLCGLGYEKTVEKHSADALEIERLLRKYCAQYFDEHENDLENVIKNTSFGVSVRLKEYNTRIK